MILKTMFTFLAMGTMVLGHETGLPIVGNTLNIDNTVAFSSELCRDSFLELIREKDLENATMDVKKEFVEEILSVETRKENLLEAVLWYSHQKKVELSLSPYIRPFNILLSLLSEQLQAEMVALYEVQKKDIFCEIPSLTNLLKKYNKSLEVLVASLPKLNLEAAEQTVKQQFVKNMILLDLEMISQMEKVGKTLLEEYGLDISEIINQQEISLGKIYPLLPEAVREEIREIYTADYTIVNRVLSGELRKHMRENYTTTFYDYK